MTALPTDRQPPHNLEAERAVLGSLLVMGVSGMDPAPVLTRLSAPAFYVTRHRAIFEAIQGVHSGGQAIDAVTVEAEIVRQGRGPTVGGPSGDVISVLVDLGDHVPTVSNVQHYVDRVREKAAAREALRVGEDLAAAIRSDSLGHLEALAVARSEIQRIERRESKGTEPSILRPLDPRWLRDFPPARRWALRRPTKAGKPCPRHEGDGMLPLGKVALLVADGGVGKTMALIALAISIATGRPWLGYFVPGEDATGKVLLILAEEDDDEVHRRLFNAAAALEIDERERSLVERRLVVLPTDGLNLSLADNAGDPTPDLVALRSALETTGPWSLVAADPFGQLVGLDAETDNAVATRTLRSLRVLTTAPGTPTLLLAHHASLDGMNSGKPRSRGVTGIRNAARWEATLRNEDKGKGVLFRQTKTNYSIPMTDELRLVRDNNGLLRVASEEEEQEREQRQDHASEGAQAEKDARREAKMAKLQAELLDRLARLPQLPTTKLQIQSLAKGDRLVRVEAVELLLATKRLLPPQGKGEPYRLASLAGTQIELPKAKE